MSEWDSWVGKTESVDDLIVPAVAARMEATLGGSRTFSAGDELPLLRHWLYFIEPAPASQIGTDGHPNRGGFLPPIALPRRMWAGGRIEFLQPLRIGDTLRRTSEIKRISQKAGSSGQLIFLLVQHTISNGGEVLLREEQDIVYRETSGAVAVETSAAPSRPVLMRQSVTPDPVLLFRYSALTFNGHRIHYDFPYVTTVEGYPGLVVHGPLTATLLLDLAQRVYSGRAVQHFAFRDVRPLFSGSAFDIVVEREAGGSIKLAALTPHGNDAMTAEVRLD